MLNNFKITIKLEKKSDSLLILFCFSILVRPAQNIFATKDLASYSESWGSQSNLEIAKLNKIVYQRSLLSISPTFSLNSQIS